MEIRRQEDLYHHRRGWLETDWHFSFGGYYDPNNMGYGPLRVLNNDRIDGGGGFPTHSHSDMEILTWIIEGQLEHEDSSGGGSVIGPREVQVMTAGTGIAHSEYNPSETEPVHLIQLWIEPWEQGLDPTYREASFEQEELEQRFVPVASGRIDSRLELNQDASVLVAYPRSGDTAEVESDPGRNGYFVTMTGSVELNGEELKEGDAAFLPDPDGISVQATEDARVMFIDIPESD